jgi:hypothetical protein
MLMVCIQSCHFPFSIEHQIRYCLWQDLTLYWICCKLYELEALITECCPHLVPRARTPKSIHPLQLCLHGIVHNCFSTGTILPIGQTLGFTKLLFLLGFTAVVPILLGDGWNGCCYIFILLHIQECLQCINEQAWDCVVLCEKASDNRLNYIVWNQFSILILGFHGDSLLMLILLFGLSVMLM